MFAMLKAEEIDCKELMESGPLKDSVIYKAFPYTAELENVAQADLHVIEMILQQSVIPKKVQKSNHAFTELVL